MGYGLNACVSPDMKLASTIIEKPFKNLGATVLCDGLMEYRMPSISRDLLLGSCQYFVLCSVTNDVPCQPWFQATQRTICCLDCRCLVLTCASRTSGSIMVLRVPCWNVILDDWQQTGSICLLVWILGMFSSSQYLCEQKNQLFSHQILKTVKGALALSAKMIRNTSKYLNSQSYQ